jgi:hypothetical protein
LLEPQGLPVSGVEQARRFEDPQLPPNELMGEAWQPPGQI